MVLSDFENGQKARIVRISGGGQMRGRLMTMGIREGAEITIVNQPSHRGPVVISVSGTQFALGHGVASRVIAEPVNP
jgi:ferrous iron transport protein A